MQQKPEKASEEAMQKPYQFWSTQPVPKMGKLLNLLDFKIEFAVYWV